MATNIKNRKSLGSNIYQDDFGKQQYTSNGSYPHDQYDQVLFRPGQVIQNRELNFLQTVLREKIATSNSVEFKNGSIAMGGNVTIVTGNSTYEMTVSDSVIYWDGCFYKVPEQTLSFTSGDLTFFENDATKIGYYIAGYNPIYQTIEQTDDSTLGDPVILYRQGNNIRGADRLKLSFILEKKLITWDTSEEVIKSTASMLANKPQFIDALTIEAVDNSGITFAVNYNNRLFEIKEIERRFGGSETDIIAGIKIHPLYGLEAYLQGGYGDLSDDFSAVNIAGWTNRLTDDSFKYFNNEPFAVQITDGVGKLNGSDIVNNQTRTFFFDKTKSTNPAATGTVEEVMFSEDSMKQFIGVPYQLLVASTQYDIDSWDVTTGTITSSTKFLDRLTPDAMIYPDDRDTVNFTGYHNRWNPYVNARRYARPGSKVAIYATKFKNGGTIENTIAHGADIGNSNNQKFLVGYAYVAQMFDMSQCMRKGTSHFLYGGGATNNFDHNTFALFYHRWNLIQNDEAANYHSKTNIIKGANFGHILELSNSIGISEYPYTVAVDFTSASYTKAKITEFEIKLVLDDIDDTLAGFEVSLGTTLAGSYNYLSTREQILSSTYPNDALVGLSSFNIYPSILTIVEEERRKFYKNYPHEIKTAFQKLSYPYEKKINNIEISTTTNIGKNEGVSVTSPDETSPDYAEINLLTLGVDGKRIYAPKCIQGVWEAPTTDKIYFQATTLDKKYVDNNSTMLFTDAAYHSSAPTTVTAKGTDLASYEINNVLENIIVEKTNNVPYSIDFPTKNINNNRVVSFELEADSESIALGLIASLESNNGAFVALVTSSFTIAVTSSELFGTYLSGGGCEFLFGSTSSSTVFKVFEWKRDASNKSKIKLICSDISSFMVNEVNTAPIQETLKYKYINSWSIGVQKNKSNSSKYSPAQYFSLPGDEIVPGSDCGIVFYGHDPANDNAIASLPFALLDFTSTNVSNIVELTDNTKTAPYGTYYSALQDVSDASNSSTYTFLPILASHKLFIHTMPKYIDYTFYNGRPNKLSDVCNIAQAVNITGYGKVSGNIVYDINNDVVLENDPYAVDQKSAINHSIEFDTADSFIGIEENDCVENRFKSQMTKLKESYGMYFENLTGDKGYHICADFDFLGTQDNKNEDMMAGTAWTNSWSKLEKSPFGVYFAADMFLNNIAKQQRAWLKLNYEIHLPVVNHFFIDDNNVINYVQTTPSLMEQLNVFQTTNALYVGSIHVPPVGFYGYPTMVYNINDKYMQLLDNMHMTSEIERNKNLNDLIQIYETSKRNNTPNTLFMEFDVYASWIQITKHNLMNCNTIDLFTLVSTDRKDTLHSTFSSPEPESDTQDWNVNNISFNLQNQEITAEMFDTHIALSAEPSKSIFSVDSNYLQKYNAYGREYVTLKPAGKIKLVDTKDSVYAYSSYVDASYKTAELPGFKIREIKNNDGIDRFTYKHTAITTWLPNKYTKCFDSCSINSIGNLFYLKNSKIETDESIGDKKFEIKYNLPLNRMYFSSFAPTKPSRLNNSGNMDDVQRISTVNEIYTPLVMFNPFCNNVNAKYLNRQTWSDDTQDDLNVSNNVFGFYPIPFEVSCQLFGTEIDLSTGTNSDSLIQQIVFDNIPVIDSEYTSFTAPATISLHQDPSTTSYYFKQLKSSWYWHQDSTNWSCNIDGTSDFLQSCALSGNHALGCTIIKDNKIYHSTKIIKNGAQWKYQSHEFDYINSNIIEPHFYYYISSVSAMSDFDTFNNLHNTTNVILPKVAQCYRFKEEHVLSDVKIYLQSNPWHDTVGEFDSNLEEMIAVYFGFLINGKLDPNGFIHTMFIRRGDVNWTDRSVMMNLPLPIYIPQDKDFFIGILHISEDDNEISPLNVKIVDNGGYDQVTPVAGLISYPSNCYSKLVYGETEFINKMLKIDLYAYQYEINVNSSVYYQDSINIKPYSDYQMQQLVENFDNWTVSTNNVLSRVHPMNDSTHTFPVYQPQKVVRFMHLDDNIVPEYAFVENYFYKSTSVNGSSYVYKPFKSNSDVVIDVPQSDLRFKTVLKTSNPNVSPIVKCGNNPGIHVFEYVRNDISYAGSEVLPARIPAASGTISTEPMSDIVNPFSTIDITRGTPDYQTVSDGIKTFDTPFEYTPSSFVGISLSSDQVVAIDGSVLEINVNNLRGSYQVYNNTVYGPGHGNTTAEEYWGVDRNFTYMLNSKSYVGIEKIENFGYIYNGAETLLLANIKHPIPLFRIAFDFFDPHYNTVDQLLATEIPVSLSFKELGYRGVEQNLIGAKQETVNEQISWKPALAFNTSWMSNNSKGNPSGITYNIKKLEKNWFRQELEFIPMGLIRNSVIKEYFETSFNPWNNTSNIFFSTYPKILFPLENFEFLIRIGLSNVNGRAAVLKNIKYSFDIMDGNISYINIENRYLG